MTNRHRYFDCYEGSYDGIEYPEDLQAIAVRPMVDNEEPKPAIISQAGSKRPHPDGHLERVEVLAENACGRCITCGEKHCSDEKSCRVCGGRLVK